MPSFSNADVQLYYEVHGSGPAILLTHGFSATSQMWQGQIEALSKEHTLIVWDMRGHGRSDAPPDDTAYTEALTVQDMAGLLDHLGFDKAVIGGLSLGGYMSLAFHAEHRERTQALLVIDTGPGYKRDDSRAAWNASAIDRAADIERLGMQALTGGSPERARSEHQNLDGIVRAARGMLTQHGPHVIESLPDVSVPTIVVAGADDQPFLAATDYMAKKIPGASKVIIPNAGHAVNIDQPAASNDSIVAFLHAHDL